MDAYAYLNGRFLPRDRAAFDVEDRGLLFADGVYEVLRVYGGRMFEGEAHLYRLRQSLASIYLPEPPDVNRLLAISEELIRRNDCPEAKVYWQITRGSAGTRDFAMPRDPQPSVLALTDPLSPVEPELPRGWRVTIVPDLRWKRCDIKSLMLLPAVLAQEDARGRGFDAAVFQSNGIVTEGTSFNVMIVRGGDLWTHPANHTILDGVTRRFVLELAQEIGVICRETPFSVEAFTSADEAFACSTTRQIVPITEVDAKRIGNGNGGPVTQRLHEAFMERVGAISPMKSQI